jgi:hypothetical protein
VTINFKIFLEGEMEAILPFIVALVGWYFVYCTKRPIVGAFFIVLSLIM